MRDLTIKPGVTELRLALERSVLVSIHSRLLSRELLAKIRRDVLGMAVSIHSRLLSRELRASDSDPIKI